MDTMTKVNYKVIDNIHTVVSLFNDLIYRKEPTAYDFEVSSKFTMEDKEKFKVIINNGIGSDTERLYKQYINSNGLSHPSLTYITHLSIGISSTEGYVVVCHNNAIRKEVLNYLTNVEHLQIWHNYGYDGNIIYYHTKKIVPNFIDTQLLARCILNDVDPLNNKTNLKHLMAYKYGEWAISKDEFKLEEMWNPKVIEYAATDACATYALFEDICNDINVDMSYFDRSR